jgi:PAB1-binding protein PBP1
MAKYDDVPLYMQSPERLQQFRRESEQALQRRTEQQNMEETLQFRNAFEEQAFDMKRDTLGMHLQSPKSDCSHIQKQVKEGMGSHGSPY